MESYTSYLCKRFAIPLGNMFVVRQMFLQNGHLASAYARTDIRQAVIESYCFMLVIRICLACLRRQPHMI